MNSREVMESWKALLESVAVHTEKHYDDEMRSWLTAAILQIWAGNKLFAEDYVCGLSVLWERDFTVTQVATALDCAGESRELKVPDFFREIVAKDLENGTDISRSVTDEIGWLLAKLALINGDFTMEEAKILRSINNLLLDYCDGQSVLSGKKREYRPEMITPLSKNGYYKKTDGQKAEDIPEKKVEGKPPVVASGSEDTATITLTINLTPDGNIESTEGPMHNKEGKAVEDRKQGAEDTLESVMEELNGLVGLSEVKEDIQSLMNFIKICQIRTQHGMKVPTVSYHLVFTGNPGTGKTTVARMVAKLYYLMGILPQGQLVETDRSGLVAGYLGQTAIKTQKVIQEALGGILFIDEAYSLANDSEDSYGKEAIETLLKAMEDHRDELVVIVAGYDNLMHQFIDSNPGLRSRFNKYFHFPDYCGEDLLLILRRFCETNGYALAEDAIPHLQKKLDEMYTNREVHFGNARSIRNLFEQAIGHQANRLVTQGALSEQDLSELALADILPAMEEM